MKHFSKDHFLKDLSSIIGEKNIITTEWGKLCLLYTSPSPRDAHESRMPSSA